MRKIFLLFGIIMLTSYNDVECQISLARSPEHKLSELKKAVTDNLKNNILSWWSVKIPDEVNGGFYGRINGSNVVFPDAAKGGILNARLLWTWSAAYRVTKNPEYLKLATRSRDYILTHFIDRESGGAFMSLNAKGEPLDTRKHTYTQAFFIYGLSEYSRATGDKEALEEARKIFELFEKHVLDKESNGYFEVFTRDWQRSRDRLIGEKSPADEKTMNTSLHVMEAYANLYRIWPDNIMAERLRNMVEIFLDKIIDNNTGHLICFFDKRWNGTSRIDSYGHDIESSWLLYEAAHLLRDDSLIDRVKKVSISIANAAMEGIAPDGSMLTEKDNATGHTSTNRSWWEQAEAVVGYVNAYELTGDEKYLNIAINSWNYIDRYFVDRKYGSWFTSVTPDGSGRGEKAGNWLCPYHNGRMCMEIIERVK